MGLLNVARSALLRLRMSIQQAAQPLPSKGQVEEVVREMTKEQKAKKQKEGSYRYQQEQQTPNEGLTTYELPDQIHRPYSRSLSEQQGGQGGLLLGQGGLLQGLGLGAGRFPIRDALATFIKSKAAPHSLPKKEQKEAEEQRLHS